MTLERQKQLLQEIVSEYDLQTVIDALLVQHSPDAIRDALPGASCHCDYCHGEHLSCAWCGGSGRIDLAAAINRLIVEVEELKYRQNR